jgi:hypothetical protein
MAIGVAAVLAATGGIFALVPRGGTSDGGADSAAFPAAPATSTPTTARGPAGATTTTVSQVPVSTSVFEGIPEQGDVIQIVTPDGKVTATTLSDTAFIPGVTPRDPASLPATTAPAPSELGIPTGTTVIDARSDIPETQIRVPTLLNVDACAAAREELTKTFPGLTQFAQAAPLIPFKGSAKGGCTMTDPNFGTVELYIATPDSWERPSANQVTVPGAVDAALSRFEGYGTSIGAWGTKAVVAIYFDGEVPDTLVIPAASNTLAWAERTVP